MVGRLVEEIPRFFTYYTMVFLLDAMGRTLLMTVVGCGLGFVGGFGLVYLRKSTSPFLLPLRVLAVAYVEIFRRIPFLVILFIVMYAVQVLTFEVSLFMIAIIAICVIAMAFMSEIIRAGFESIPRQQLEAAEVMNFSRWQTVRLVILPQAWKVILPPAIAFAVMFIKDTSLASHVSVIELTYVGKILNNRGFSAILVFGTVLVCYFILSYPLSRLGAWLENRLASPRSEESEQRVRLGFSPAQRRSYG
jgi:polar amino acid transport system permease protein